MATADILCFVCCGSLPSQIDQKLVRRLRSVLELEDGSPALAVLETAYLCTVCNMKLLQIEELITDLKEVYHVKAKQLTLVQNEGGTPATQTSQEPAAIAQELATAPVTSSDHVNPDIVGDISTPSVLGDHTYGNKEGTVEVTDVPEVTDAPPVKKRKLDCGCGAVFTEQNDLEAHRRDNHGGGIVCRDCGLTLTDAAQIKAHSNAHTSDAFKCIICGEGFSQIASLKLHQRFSTSCSSHFEVEDDVNCGCGAEFKTPQEFRLHREKEHGGRFACGMCKKTYSSHIHLQRHHQQVHNKDNKEKPKPQRKSQRERKTTDPSDKDSIEEEQPSTSRLTPRQRSLRKTRVSASVKAALAEEGEDYLDDDNDEDYVTEEEPTEETTKSVSGTAKPTKWRLRSSHSPVDTSFTPKHPPLKICKPRRCNSPGPNSSAGKRTICEKSIAFVEQDKLVQHWCKTVKPSKSHPCSKFSQLSETKSELNDLTATKHKEYAGLVTENQHQSISACSDLRKHINRFATHVNKSDKKSKARCSQQSSIDGQSAIIEPQELKCEICDRMFKNQRGFTNHQRHGKCGTKKKYKKKREFLCSICGATYATSGCFTEHMAGHTDAGELECEYCGKKFVHGYQLRVHREQHTRPYMCQQCGKRCSTLSHMQEHQLIHSSDLKFSCDLCGQRFRWRLSLVRHLWMTHKQGEPLKTKAYKVTCTLCEQVLRSSSRARHFKRNHTTVKYDAEYFTRMSNKQSESTTNVQESGGVNAVLPSDCGHLLKQSTEPTGDIIISNQNVLNNDNKNDSVIDYNSCCTSPSIKY